MIIRAAFVVCIMLHHRFILRAAAVNPTKTSRSLLRSGLLRRSQQSTVPVAKTTVSTSLSTVASIPAISKVPIIANASFFSPVGSTSSGNAAHHHLSNRSYLIPSSFPPWSGSLSDLKPLIMHEDDHIIVVYKPPSILIQSEAAAAPVTTITSFSCILRCAFRHYSAS